ncbi:MAG: AmmeMemoRadiSam system protein B [candidate division WOR-3 bacterium]|nr:AmmeMemoRadiSam system protein B [candidate division WOR-3 bacterium]
MIREAVVAGQFYPGDKKILQKTVDDLLIKTTTPKIHGKIIGIVVPHAGYPYSGPTAAYAYKAIAEKDIQTVIMLGPTHRVFIQGFAVYGQGSWQTPLGQVAIDESVAQAIITQSNKIRNLPDAHSEEHSLEVQLPFLQRTLKDFKIVPIMSLEPTFNECQILAQAIANVIKNKNVVLLASSDLYHGYSYDACKKTDALTLSYLEKFDPEGLYNALKQDKAQACGGYPIVIVMLTSKLLGANQSQILHQTNSNDVMGERGGYCVGYASAIFYKTETKSKTDEIKTNDINQHDIIQLTEQEKKELLRIARTTIENHIVGKKIPEFKPITEKLKEQYGVFVTLKKRGQLRGCIGYVQGIKPLYQAVSDMAIAASTEDPRFPRVTANELKDITIEITVMTPLRRIKNINEIQVGKHGIVIKRGYNQGLLLPQVATEEGWDRETFLKHTCWKAGLPENAWQDRNTEIYVFSGTIIKESE